MKITLRHELIILKKRKHQDVVICRMKAVGCKTDFVVDLSRAFLRFVLRLDGYVTVHLLVKFCVVVGPSDFVVSYGIPE